MSWERMRQHATIVVAGGMLVACGAAPAAEVLGESATPEPPPPPSQAEDTDGHDGQDGVDRDAADRVPVRPSTAPPDDGDTPWHLLPEDDRPSIEVFEPDCEPTNVDTVPC